MTGRVDTGGINTGIIDTVSMTTDTVSRIIHTALRMAKVLGSNPYRACGDVTVKHNPRCKFILYIYPSEKNEYFNVGIIHQKRVLHMTFLTNESYQITQCGLFSWICVCLYTHKHQPLTINTTNRQSLKIVTEITPRIQ